MQDENPAQVKADSMLQGRCAKVCLSKCKENPVQAGFFLRRGLTLICVL